MNRTPDIRFAGFTGDWERKKWENTIDISTEMVNPASGEYDNMPHIAPGNIESFTGRILDNVKTVREEQLVSGKFRFRPGDIVYGKIRPQLGKYFYADVNGLTSADAYVLKAKDEIAQEFLFSLLQTNDFFRYSVSVSMRSGMPKINRDELNVYRFMAPSKEEQILIGRFMLQIGKAITLQQRKVEKLLQIKEALLEKMFPKAGVLVPDIRFSGFTGDWEQRKLGELALFSKGNGYSKADLREAGVPIILYGRLYTRYETVIKEVDTFAEGKEGAVYSHGGEVIVPASGETAEDIAIASVVERPGVILGGDLNVISPNKDIDSAFLALSISNGKPHNDMAKRAQGKSVVHLHNEDLAQIDLCYPSMNEQQKISACIAALEKTIALQQRKMEKLQRIKKALLEKMFV